MRKFFVVIFVFVICFCLFGLLDGYQLTSTPEGTFLTKEYASPWAETSTGEGGDRVCVSVDRGGKIRKVTWESYSNRTENSYDSPFWIVYEIKADPLNDTYMLDNSSVQNFLTDYYKYGGPKF